MNQKFELNTSVYHLVSTGTRSKCLLSPVEKQYSTMFANSIRTVMLESGSSSHISCFKINGSRHLYDNIPGVVEDLYVISDSLSKVLIKSSKFSEVITLEKQGPCSIYASDILDGGCVSNEELEVLNRDLYICNVLSGHSVKMTFLVEYANAGSLPYNSKYLSDGYIHINRRTNPVKHVSYNVLSYRTYDEVLFDVVTDGTLCARDVFKRSLTLLSNKFSNLKVLFK